MVLPYGLYEPGVAEKNLLNTGGVTMFVKQIDVKPMDAEEAVMEMEMIGHSFFVFRNGETDEINVVYKRKNGSYGLIEPEA